MNSTDRMKRVSEVFKLVISKVNRTKKAVAYGYVTGGHKETGLHQSLSFLVNEQKNYIERVSSQMYLDHNSWDVIAFKLSQHNLNAHHRSSNHIEHLAGVFLVEELAYNDIFLYVTYLDGYQPGTLELETVIMDVNQILEDELTVGRLSNEQSVVYSGRRVAYLYI